MLVRPRLTDHHGIHLAQEGIDFAIPFLGEDIPLCIDPFLLWANPSMHYQSLHGLVVNSFNAIGHRFKHDRSDELVQLLVDLSECDEVGLGFSSSKAGRKMPFSMAKKVLELFQALPDVEQNGFSHFEVIQLLVEGLSKDRISDISASILKSHLIDYTTEQCDKYGIPTEKDVEVSVFDQRSLKLKSEKVRLPVDPVEQRPLMLVPKHWLRKVPWINGQDYSKGYLPERILEANITAPEKGELVTFNRHNFGYVKSYLEVKERKVEDCKDDPIFDPLPLGSVKRKLSQLEKLPTGKTDGADRIYEEVISQILTTVLFPHLDFAREQERTESGIKIRDLIFYNNRQQDFLDDIYNDYESRQLVFELKNVREVEPKHMDQLNRYLAGGYGKFGVVVTRNSVPNKMIRNAVDLWSGQRKAIVFLTDSEIRLMVSVFESKQRMPIEVLKKVYLDFRGKLPI